MNAHAKDTALATAILDRFDPKREHRSTFDLMEAAKVLRRAQMTLHRWAEEECNGTIQRDGVNGDGKPMRVFDMPMRHGGQWKQTTMYIPDREAGALRRVAEVCKAAGLHYYHQTDPRGCALYVSTEPLTDQNYSRGIACL